MSNVESFFRNLPNSESARHFVRQLEETNPQHAAKLEKNQALFSDVVTLAAYSPVIASTILQNPHYLIWLDRERRIEGVRSREELLESLARFSLTNSQLDPHTLLSRFRRRELIRIFLKDIRRLATIAEITDELSALADAILEYALRIARQEIENRFGTPFTVEDAGRTVLAECCVVAVGKLGSRELNYSSDIDLLFLYSGEGNTKNSKETLTNREYFIKLAEHIIRTVGQASGEGAAYRVDMRLRPHGRVGPLAISVADAIRYYREIARTWERQVLIRSRASAGSAEIFRRFFSSVESSVFSSTESVENALANVLQSKQKIDLEQHSRRGFHVKLGKGGIREIEFIAQALQLAYGGRDRWIRAPHTLISLSRLNEHGYLSEDEFNQLYDAYRFLRRLEHLLQMEHGLQTHSVPTDGSRRSTFASRMQCANLQTFDRELKAHTTAVRKLFERVFDNVGKANDPHASLRKSTESINPEIEKPAVVTSISPGIISLTPRYADLLKKHAAPHRSQPLDQLPTREFYLDEFSRVCDNANDFRKLLNLFRETWFEQFARIVKADLECALPLGDVKRAQSALAEATIDTALHAAAGELTRRGIESAHFPIAVLGLGKLGSRGLDYDSDLDVVIVYDESAESKTGKSIGEIAGRLAEVFVNILSGITREGSMYRVDLRLRPYGSDGPIASGANAFAEYFQTIAIVWEWLAYVKLRASAGDLQLGGPLTGKVQDTIFARATEIQDVELAAETRKIRTALERHRVARSRANDIDIKFGSGGMLDIYFSVRFLQLRDRVLDRDDNRSTPSTLNELFNRGSLTNEQFTILTTGYEFLSRLDHALRLTSGRSSRLP
ncbi:MAG: hypothetical protein LC734_03985, partial [Acidobacteria bacterium]|nr:hypothetical protein [Acidobacteriota bacterium]